MAKRSDRERILILGAAGRDFHDFNVFFRTDPRYEVVGFTAAQIPRIACREYPPSLAGELYPSGLPIWPECDLERIIRDQMVDRCILAYSDLSHQQVMALASRVLSEGADFAMLGGSHTMLSASKPVIAICAVRTGSGKSQTSRYITDQIRDAGLQPVVVRHPMPYGNLEDEAVQRFAVLADLDDADVTIEEREEYESHIRKGTVVFAGVDYESILRLAEKESDVIVWDGGNNDTPFFKPDLWITIADPLRPGDEIAYYPGETNFRAAHLIVINKANVASKEALSQVKSNALRLNPGAVVVTAASEVSVQDPEMIKGMRVLVIEDGPTLTHGGMPYGAGKAAAVKFGASELVDPRPFAVGSIRDVFEKFGHIDKVLPAMGYYPEQIDELRQTINNADCDSVIIATPVDLRRIIEINKPATAVYYELKDMEEPFLKDEISRFISRVKGGS